MVINAKLNDTAQKILWEEAVHMRECARNSMGTMGIQYEYSIWKFLWRENEDHWFIIGVWKIDIHH